MKKAACCIQLYNRDAISSINGYLHNFAVPLLFLTYKATTAQPNKYANLCHHDQNTEGSSLCMREAAQNECKPECCASSNILTQATSTRRDMRHALCSARQQLEACHAVRPAAKSPEYYSLQQISNIISHYCIHNSHDSK